MLNGFISDQFDDEPGGGFGDPDTYLDPLTGGEFSDPDESVTVANPGLFFESSTFGLVDDEDINSDGVTIDEAQEAADEAGDAAAESGSWILDNWRALALGIAVLYLLSVAAPYAQLASSNFGGSA